MALRLLVFLAFASVFSGANSNVATAQDKPLSGDARKEEKLLQSTKNILNELYKIGGQSYETDT